MEEPLLPRLPPEIWYVILDFKWENFRKELCRYFDEHYEGILIGYEEYAMIWCSSPVLPIYFCKRLYIWYKTWYCKIGSTWKKLYTDLDDIYRTLHKPLTL